VEPIWAKQFDKVWATCCLRVASRSGGIRPLSPRESNVIVWASGRGSSAPQLGDGQRQQALTRCEEVSAGDRRCGSSESRRRSSAEHGIAPRVSTRRPCRDLELSGSSERPGVAQRAQPRTLRPFGALLKGSSEPQGSPHVRHGVFTRRLGRWGRRPSLRGREAGLARSSGCTGSADAVACATWRLFGADGWSGVGATSFPRSLEPGFGRASGLFGDTPRGDRPVLMSSWGSDAGPMVSRWSSDRRDVRGDEVIFGSPRSLWV
jgi:hypothetical protein